MSAFESFAPFVPRTMNDLSSFATLGVITLPTFLMSSWHRTRRFAHVPLIALSFLIGGFACYRLGEDFRSLDPCGTGAGIFVVCLVWIGIWLFTAGLVLLIWQSSRTIVGRIVVWGLPLYMLACVLGGIFGRYLA